MKVELKEDVLIVTKEPDDKPIYKETQLYYNIKKKLTEQGYDVIKKLAYKDGNLVDDNQYYIRDRNNKYAIYDQLYVIRSLPKKYREEGSVKLTVLRE